MLDTRTPPVTVHQIVRYLANRYAHSTKEARLWKQRQHSANDYDERERAGNYCLDYLYEAQHTRRILRDLVHDQVSTWRIGTKENKP